jgi:hypothetical protein
MDPGTSISGSSKGAFAIAKRLGNIASATDAAERFVFKGRSEVFG